MRNIFAKTLLDIAKKDSRVILITADLGFGLFDEFVRELPDQFLNVGVAEQNMIGIAAGLSLEGFIPYCYSIANFSFMRCLEQIRNDVCYHDLNVNIVSNGAGFSYGPLGMSHHATEDISIMRSLPNIEVLIPASQIDTVELTNYSYMSNMPNYIRLDKTHTDLDVPTKENEPWKVLREGKDVCIVAAGGVTQEALTAAAELKAYGHDVKVISVLRIAPEDKLKMSNYFSNINHVLTIEENVKSGGLGSYIVEHLSDFRMPLIVKRFAIEDKYESTVGDQMYLRKINNLTSKDLIQYILNISSQTKGKNE